MAEQAIAKHVNVTMSDAWRDLADEIGAKLHKIGRCGPRYRSAAVRLGLWRAAQELGIRTKLNPWETQ